MGRVAIPLQIPVEQQVVDDFNTSHSEIELLMEVVAHDTAVDAINAEINAGNAPDIVGPVGWSGSNSFNGQWQDLTNLIAASGFNTSQFNSTLYDWYNMDGQQVALPFAVYPSAMYYNPALFAAAGLNPPPAHYGDKYVLDGEK